MSGPADTEFYPRVEAVMALAHAQENQAPPDRVAMSAAFAASRYDAWLCARLFQNPQIMAEKRGDAERVYVEEFRAMFLANYDDFLKNWDSLMADLPQDGPGRGG